MPGRMRHLLNVVIKNIRAFLNFFVKKAWGRTLVSCVMPVLSAFCSATLILQLTSTDKLTSTTTVDWANILTKSSFYALVVLAVITLVYNKACLQSETSTARSRNEAKRRKKILDVAAEVYIEIIRSRKGPEFHEAMDETKKIYKREPLSDEGR